MFYLFVMLRSYTVIIVQCQFKTSNQVINLYLQFTMQFLLTLYTVLLTLKDHRDPDIYMLYLLDLCELCWKFCQSSSQITLAGNKIY